MLYPGSTPDFRILRSADGSWSLQVRYINIAQGYRSLWQDVPIFEVSDEPEPASPQPSPSEANNHAD